jgi:glutathione peroxidase
MRVSYVRKVQDQARLTPEEIQVLKNTYFRAIINGHTEVIEELLTRGMPLLAILENKKTALRIAFEHDSPKVFEMLLIESMRTFQLFPHQDVMDSFAWMIHKRHYVLVDLTLFALEQHPISQAKFSYFIKINKHLDKIIELCEKEECSQEHLDKLKVLLHEKELSQEELQYFYSVWERKIAGTTPIALNIYAMLADNYDEVQAHCDKKSAVNIFNKMIFSIIMMWLCVLIFDYQLLDRHLLGSYILSLSCALLSTALVAFFSYKIYKNYRLEISQYNQSSLNRSLLKACREGDKSAVSDLIHKGAYINALMGIAHSTPLYEAIRFERNDLSSFMLESDAYAGVGQLLKGNLWNYSLKTPAGADFPLANYRDKYKVIVLVNIASRCDFTPQLHDLEVIYQEFKSQGLMVIGVPSNDFLGKEPLTDEYITEFCQLNYGVTFPIMSKIHVTQQPIDPLYSWLSEHTKPKWNFQKYIFDKNGDLIESFEPMTLPTSQAIRRIIKQLLNQA